MFEKTDANGKWISDDGIGWALVDPTETFIKSFPIEAEPHNDFPSQEEISEAETKVLIAETLIELGVLA